MLAVRLMQEQGIDVVAVNFKTAFTCCQDTSAQAAQRLGVPLTILSAGDDYFDLVRHPQFGYGKGANPCIDCRVYMFQRAERMLPEFEAQFLVSGEVLGQRPKSQKRRDLEIIAHHSSQDDLLLRPLSAQRLPPTRPEREGWVDRRRLHGFVGRGRRELIALAQQLGIEDIPAPSNGCALTEIAFSRKVFDLIELQPQAERADFELLAVGRHFRWSPQTKVIVARNEQECELLRRSVSHDTPGLTALLPDDFPGPTAVVVGPADDAALAFAAGLIHRFSREFPAAARLIVNDGQNGTRTVGVLPHPQAAVAATIAEA
jgi:hypothetical protein